MLTVIREFFLKRTYKKIKGLDILGAIAKLEILIKLTPNVNVSTFVKDRFNVEAHCDNVVELPVMLMSVTDDVEVQRSLFIPTKYTTLKGGSVSEWCLTTEDEYVSLLEMTPKILKALKELQAALDKNEDDFYVDYVKRKSIYFISDAHQFITALKTIHY